MIVTGVAVGVMGVGSVAILFQHLKREPKASEQTEEEKDEKEEVEVNMPDALTYLCINTADLEDVAFLLTLFSKRFHVIDAPVNMTAGPTRWLPSKWSIQFSAIHSTRFATFVMFFTVMICGFGSL
jgi:hypothetical protein